MNRCMAACFCLHQTRGLAATLGNHRFLFSPRTRSPSSSFLLPRRAVHNSVYDKNPDDHALPTVVPDDVIQSQSQSQSDQYWAPHPKTGVFGPATEQSPGDHGFPAPPTNSTTADSVLEQKAFFRPLEDLEKPPPQP